MRIPRFHKRGYGKNLLDRAFAWKMRLIMKMDRLHNEASINC
jgi:hypothetical protein